LEFQLLKFGYLNRSEIDCGLPRVEEDGTAAGLESRLISKTSDGAGSGGFHGNPA